MNSRSHSYWIPTNRNAAAAVTSYLREIDYWYRLTGVAIPLFVLDSGDPAVEAHNAREVAMARSAYPDLSICHLDLARQQAIVAELLRRADLPASLIDSIAPHGLNYGAVVNKIAVFAALLGSDVIHRRDSDTALQANCPYPLEAEMQLLAAGPAGQRNYLAGSGYVGEWNLDLKPFLDVSPELFSRFWSGVGVPEHLHAAIYEWVDGNSRALFQADRVDYANADGFYLPDAGNMAAYQLHLLFPSLPSDAMSSDYTLFKLAAAFKLPVSYHQRRVVHAYHTGRKAQPMPYIMSLLKYCDMRPIYSALQRELAQLAEAGAVTLHGPCQDTVASLLAGLADANLAQRRDALHNFVDGFIARLYPDQSALLLADLDSVLDACRRDYHRHAGLIRSWPALMRAAAEHGSVLRRRLQDDATDHATDDGADDATTRERAAA